MRQYLLSLNPSVQPLTGFKLVHVKTGTELDPEAQLSTISDLADGDEIEARFVAYSAASALAHVQQVREAFAIGGTASTGLGIGEGPTLFQGVPKPVSEQEPAAADAKEKSTDDKTEGTENNEQTEEKVVLPDLDELIKTEKPIVDEEDAPSGDVLASLQPAISQLVARTIPKGRPAVKSLQLSQWNPVPRHLALKGHLLYLHAITLENKTFHITAHAGGFFVNNSTTDKFDPSPRKISGKYHQAATLYELLTRLSPSIEQRVQENAEAILSENPLLSVRATNSFLAAPWLVDVKEHPNTPDLGRTQKVSQPEADESRNWIEDLQSARELPKTDEEGNNSVQARVFRERLLNKFSFDFAAAAVRGAQDIVHGNMTALNPTEPEVSHIFMRDNIFYSHCYDAGNYTALGGDEAARIAAVKDVAGISFVNRLDIDGLCPVATVLVNYCGRAIIAQTPVPGIFNENNAENQIVYGGTENGEEIFAKDSFRPFMEKIADACHLKEHTAYDAEGKATSLVTSVDTKGLVGTDGRNYVLELSRLAPIDIAFLEKYREDKTAPYMHEMSLLRFELVDEWFKDKARVKFTELREKRQKETEATADDKPELLENGEEEAKIIRELTAAHRVNPDVTYRVPEHIPAKDVEQYKKDQDEVREVCNFLTETVIPKFVGDIAKNVQGVPINGSHLTSMMHKRGINMRYLGALYEADAEWKTNREAFQAVIVHEAVSRALKHIIRAAIADVPAQLAPAVIVHYINLLLSPKGSKLQFDDALKALYPDETAAITSNNISAAGLRSAVKDQVLRRFRLELPDAWDTALKASVVHHEISAKLGLQWTPRNYYVPVENGPVVVPTADDLVNIVPVVRYSTFRSQMADQALDHGNYSLIRGDHEVGLQLVNEYAALSQQVYGLIHAEAAQSFSQLAMIYHQLEKDDQAVDFCLKAIAISERVFGIDSYEVFYMCQNLAMFENSRRNIMGAYTAIKHVLRNWGPISLDAHPEFLSLIHNMADILLQVHAYKSSVRWYTYALDMSTKLLGEDTIKNATIHFQLSQGYVYLEDNKAAISHAKLAFDLFNKHLGSEDQNTVNSKSWYERLVEYSVSIARQQKQAASMPKMRPRLVKTKQPQQQRTVGQAVDNDLAKAGALGDRDTQFLLDYINGSASGSKKKKSKSKKVKASA